MRGPNRRWILLLAMVLLAGAGCTENDLDESEADVLLEILSVTNPPITGEAEFGNCSVSVALQCLDNNNCPEGEVCILPPGGSECVITEWSVTFANKPLSSGASTTPYNDVVVENLTLTYDDGAYAGAQVLAIGQVIEADSTGTITFFPIAIDEVAADNTTVAVGMTFTAKTVTGLSVFVAGGTGSQLLIEDCLP